MTEQEFRELLVGVLNYGEDVEDLCVSEASSFGDVGLLTSSEGLVVRLDDGAEFQVTIVRSR